jgi:hypothetical protein
MKTPVSLETLARQALDGDRQALDALVRALQDDIYRLVVLGSQGRSQLETRYGHDTAAMPSQPATKIFLRTSEPHAAKWI